MKNFITNEKTSNLKKRLIELIKKSDELKFLVGFFYFSGIRELYEGLKEKPNINIKVLVGLNVDKTNFGLLEYADQHTHLSDEERCYKFLQSVKKSLNSEDFDTHEFYQQVRFFIKLISANKLIIRKTYNPNHAKIYLFNLEEDQVKKNLFITGSSNLTKAGITTQEEFNVEISDFGFKDAEDYFDTLWEEAVKITEDDVIKKRLIEVVEKETLIKDITPFEAFVLVLKTYLDSFGKKEIGQSLIKILEENGYTPYQYQLDAVKQALAIIENNNGVLIADVVGLGKTVIACAVARELKKRGLVICPPGLVGDKNKTSGWLKYTEEFRLYDWEVRSLGDLENIADFVKKVKDIDIVIIDEAHRFRNQDTKDYEYLKNICRDKIVILQFKAELSRVKTKIDRLTDAYLDTTLELIEFQEKKNSLMKQKKDIEEKLYDFERKGHHWLELTRNWILEANSAENLALQVDYTGMKDFLQKIGSNRRLAASTLSVDFKKPWNFLHNLSDSHCKSEADTAINQKWWR